MLGEIRIVESLAMVDHVEDWSKVRSPGRARRRRKKYRQNIQVVAVPKKDAVAIDGGRTLVMHPSVAIELRRQIGRQLDQATENFIFGDARRPAPGGALTLDRLFSLIGN